MSMKVLMMAAEAAPFAKVGGLADVIASLPLALKGLGVDVRIVLPKYRSVDENQFDILPLGPDNLVEVFLGRVPVSARLSQTVFPQTDIPVYLIENDYFFGRPGIYNDPATGIGFLDNGERYCFFCKSSLELLGKLGWSPDVIHCHDSQTGLVPAYLKLQSNKKPSYRKIRSIFTIHNLGYQGLYPREILYPSNLPEDLFYPGGPIEFYGRVNFLKTGLSFSDCLNTVSETYALEIQTGEEFGFGLQGVLRNRKRDLYGIMNGIDTCLWNPETDRYIPGHFSSSDFSGKQENKTLLLSRMGLDAGSDRIPVIGMISRLAQQKGLDLLIESLDEIMSLPLRLVILGSGDKSYAEKLRAASIRNRGKLHVHLEFDESLAHLIEAGSDMFLMPSRYEPCGLNQLYSLRYATVPIVRATGGLRDSVVDADAQPNAGTGFVFGPYSKEFLVDTLRRALAGYSDIGRWTNIMRRGMACDFSWTQSARKYLDLYKRAVTKRTRP